MATRGNPVPVSSKVRISSIKSDVRHLLCDSDNDSDSTEEEEYYCLSGSEPEADACTFIEIDAPFRLPRASPRSARASPRRTQQAATPPRATPPRATLLPTTPARARPLPTTPPRARPLPTTPPRASPRPTQPQAAAPAPIASPRPTQPQAAAPAPIASPRPTQQAAAPAPIASPRPTQQAAATPPTQQTAAPAPRASPLPTQQAAAPPPRASPLLTQQTATQSEEDVDIQDELVIINKSACNMPKYPTTKAYRTFSDRTTLFDKNEVFYVYGLTRSVIDRLHEVTELCKIVLPILTDEPVLASLVYDGDKVTFNSLCDGWDSNQHGKLNKGESRQWTRRPSTKCIFTFQGHQVVLAAGNHDDFFNEESDEVSEFRKKFFARKQFALYSVNNHTITPYTLGECPLFRLVKSNDDIIIQKLGEENVFRAHSYTKSSRKKLQESNPTLKATGRVQFLDCIQTKDDIYLLLPVAQSSTEGVDIIAQLQRMLTNSKSSMTRLINQIAQGLRQDISDVLCIQDLDHQQVLDYIYRKKMPKEYAPKITNLKNRLMSAAYVRTGKGPSQAKAPKRRHTNTLQDPPPSTNPKRRRPNPRQRNKRRRTE